MLPDVLGGNLLNSFNFIVSVLLIEQDKRSGRVAIECTMMFGFHVVLLRDAVSRVSWNQSDLLALSLLFPRLCQKISALCSTASKRRYAFALWSLFFSLSLSLSLSLTLSSSLSLSPPLSLSLSLSLPPPLSLSLPPSLFLTVKVTDDTSMLDWLSMSTCMLTSSSLK